MKTEAILHGGPVPTGQAPEHRSRRNRRGGQRLEAEQVSIDFIDEIGEPIAFQSFDLSSGGVFLYSDLLFSVGEQVLLRINIPDLAVPITVGGEVVHAGHDSRSRGPGMGVAFQKIDDGDQQALLSYVAEASGKP